MDEFTGDSGLKDDWDGTITEAEFEQGQRGNWQLKLHVAADDQDDQEFIYSVGGKDKGWSSFDGGETIQGPSAKARFHVKSGIQKFIDAAMKTDASEELKQRSKNLYDSRGPFHAALWVGLKFHWDVVEEDGQRSDSEGVWHDEKVQAVRPTRFLGAGTAATSTSSSGPATTTNGTAAASSNGSTATDSISEADLKTLTRLAKMHDDHGEFVDAVMDESSESGEKFIKNKPIMKLIGKKDWYQTARA